MQSKELFLTVSFLHLFLIVLLCTHLSYGIITVFASAEKTGIKDREAHHSLFAPGTMHPPSIYTQNKLFMNIAS